MRLELINPKNGHFAEITFSNIVNQFIYRVHAGRKGLMGFRGEISTLSVERGYTKTLRGAKAAVSQMLGYKAEWREIEDD